MCVRLKNKGVFRAKGSVFLTPDSKTLALTYEASNVQFLLHCSSSSYSVQPTSLCALRETGTVKRENANRVTFHDGKVTISTEIYMRF